MQIKSNLQILYAILVLMVAQAHCQQLMCYICDDCNKITQETPKEICDESYFNKVSTTQSPQSPPTPMTTITTDEIITSTEGTTETMTPETTVSTKAPMPTAGTAGPPISTTSLPTPPNPGTVAGVVNADAEFNTTTPLPTTTTTEISSTSGTPETTFLKPVQLDMQPAQIQVRQRRAAAAATTAATTSTTTFNPLVSYHCYVVQKTINGSLTTSRGCSSVNQTEAVCPELQLAFNNTKFDKCTPCSNSLCNGSHVFGVSIVAIILGLVSAFLLGFPA